MLIDVEPQFGLDFGEIGEVLRETGLERVDGQVKGRKEDIIQAFQLFFAGQRRLRAGMVVVAQNLRIVDDRQRIRHQKVEPKVDVIADTQACWQRIRAVSSRTRIT